MPKVDFYILENMPAAGRWHFACRLLEKIHHQKQQIYVHTENEQDGNNLDQLLWSFSDTSFIPHCLINQYSSTLAAIQIGHIENPDIPHQEILLNLHTTIPNWHKNFTRILEIVPNDDILKQHMRAHYKHYAQLGYDLSVHKIS